MNRDERREPYPAAATFFQGIVEGTMALTYPDYFPLEFLAPVVVAQAAAERDFLKTTATAPHEYKSEHDRHIAAQTYVQTVALACAQVTCDAVRAGEWSVTELASTVEDWLRRIKLHLGHDICESETSAGVWFEEAIKEMKHSLAWDEHLAQRLSLAIRLPVPDEATQPALTSTTTVVPKPVVVLPVDASKAQKHLAEKACLRAIEQSTGESANLRAIWGPHYAVATEYERWRRNDPKATPTADRKIRGVLGRWLDLREIAE